MEASKTYIPVDKDVEGINPEDIRKKAEEKKPLPVEAIKEIRKKVEVAVLSGDWSDCPLMPKSNCNKCYGRGYKSRDLRTNTLITCGCLRVKDE